MASSNSQSSAMEYGDNEFYVGNTGISTSRIIGIQFSLLSPEEIERNSVAEITSRDTYTNNKPVIGGLFDPRMGVLEPGFICPTDGLNYIHTPGYFGHIKLTRPVFFVQHLKEILDIQQCVCFKCSHLLINKKANKHLMEYPPEKRWKKVLELCKTVNRCGFDNLDGCGTKQPTRIKQEGMAIINAEWDMLGGDKKKIVVRITPEDILQKFKRITDEDVEFMGFHPKWSRPEWMVCSILPVPPPAMRPSVKHDAQQRSEDDITHIYSNIIKTNNDLREKIATNSAAAAIENTTTVLQYFIAMIVNNKTKGSQPLQQRSGRPLQCIMTRINSKTGRIRGNLMGKRVNYSARSVITGDPNLSIRELGVPMKIAKNITKPLMVNDGNRAFLMQMVLNGPDVYPGAKTLERKNGGVLISLRNVDRETIQLQNGDIVHRHMMDGDCVLFNRQPSLHRMSMMAHIVKVMRVGDTFRMNVGDTKPYNADFDGDEMNMHMCQNILAESELRNIANIPNQIISPAKNAPIIGIFQDSLLGSYRFTRKNIYFTAKDAMNLLMMFPYLRSEKCKEIFQTDGKRVNSFQILSQILPALTLTGKTKLYDDIKDEFCSSNNVLEIRNGEYIRGQIEGSVLAGTSRGLIHRIFNDFSPLEASHFIDNLQNIITEYMKTSCYSVGINDLVADNNTTDNIKRAIEQQKLKVQDLIGQLHLGLFENNTSHSNIVQFEMQVNNLLNEAIEEAGKIGRNSLDPNNRFLMIITSGSKGSLLNLSQMISCVGQTNVEGKRVPYGFDNRSLPHYCKYDDSPNARGFIENSYITGLTAEEVFFHAMGGRIGLIDTAVKSVSWETPIVIIENGKPLYIEIGRWIDGQLEQSAVKVQHFEERRLELLNIEAENSVVIPTTDADGNLTWGTITAITRHDPGKSLYNIKTKGGRSVIVTESKSLLVWDEERRQFHEKLTPEIKIGDCLPVNARLVKPPVVLEIICDGKVQLDKHIGYYLGRYYAIDGGYINVKLPKHICQYEEEIKKWINYDKEENAKLPAELFIASEECILWFLSGYFIHCCWIDITHQYIKLEYVLSKELMEGISMLCSRLGVYAEIMTNPEENYRDGDDSDDYVVEPETHYLIIQGSNAKRFAEKIPLTNDDDLNDKIKQLRIIEVKTDDFVAVNDVVCDPIVYISMMDVKKHPKMYDLTIPSTLNFGLANGLQVRDTSQTGYIQRRLIKGVEDLKVEYDMTVRNSKGKVIQFQYGDDGFDPCRVENQTIQLVGMSLEDIYAHWDIIGLAAGSEINGVKTQLRDIYTDAALKRFHKQETECKQRLLRQITEMIEKRNRIVSSVFKGKDDSVLHLPVAFQYIISNIQGQLNLNSESMTDITPLEAMELVDVYFQKLSAFHYVPVNDLFKTMYYFYMSPHDIVEKKRFHHNALVLVLETILLKFKQAFVNPGEMVGVVAGQSVGEPTTQQTLNTFHLAGSSKANATRGVPRIEEILRLTKNPKAPSITVFLKDQDQFDVDKAIHIGKIIKHTRLVHIVKKMEILFDPVEETTQKETDLLFMQQFYAFEKIMQECLNENGESGEGGKRTARSKWILRMELNNETMLENNITMDDVHFAIKNSHVRQEISCVYTDFNADNLVFRIAVNFEALKKKKMVKSIDQSDEIYLLKMFQDSLLNNVVLRGITGIKNVLTRKLMNRTVEIDGKFITKDVWVLDTTGTNLMDMLALDYIDTTKTYSNDIAEIFNVFGIEATRNSIFNELEEVMESAYINYHHLSLLCDRMTCNKNLVPIFRTGILSDDIGPIAKATFEVQTSVFLDAARHGEFDPMRGVSANVMCGQTGFYGTHGFELILDVEQYKGIKAKEIKTTPSENIATMYHKKNDCSEIREIENDLAIDYTIPLIPMACQEDDGYDMGF